MATHLFSFGKTKPQKTRPGGYRVDVSAKQFPALKGMALSLLQLSPKAIREPHWHPNAHELSYCLEGKGLMTIFSPSSGHDTFTIEAGEIIFVPMGYLHHIENIGDTPLRMLLCFSHETPEDLDLSSSAAVMPPKIMGAVFKEKPNFFENLHAKLDTGFITIQDRIDKPAYSSIPNRYKFNLEAVDPQVQTPGGWVKLSNKSLLTQLEGLAVYSLKLLVNGAREPHWHPNASELNYLISGTARITLLSPNGNVDTFDMVPGDISFMPRGYLHHIENTGKDEARFAVFFDNQNPSDIGISGAFGAYSNETLSSVFGVGSEYFKSLPKLQEDLFVVAGAG